MSKKVILIILLIIAIAVIGIGLYFVFISVLKEKPTAITPEEPAPEKILPVAPPIERYEFQGTEYEIISVGGPIYDIITGQLTEEQASLLAEKIIGDILIQEPDSQDITLFFYSDLVAAGAGEIDVAKAYWTPEGISVKMTE